MTITERKNLMAVIVATSLYYGHQVDDRVLALFVEDLEDLPYPRVMDAIKELRRDPKTIRFPLPAQIRAKILPPTTVEDSAREAVSRIINAVSKYGRNNPKEAEMYIGELGWMIVGRNGGWQNFCAELTNDNKGIMQAQMRDLGITLQNRAKRGELNTPPALAHFSEGHMPESVKLLAKKFGA